MEERRSRNLTAKILAIIMALVLWLYVTNEQNPPVEASLAIPLEVRGIGDSLVAVEMPDSVRVKVRGSRSITAGLQTQDIQAFLDLKGIGEGRHSARVHVAVPPSLELVEVQPDKVPVRIDTKVRRALGVEIRFTGTAAPGVAVAKSVATPDQVTLEGPKSLTGLVDRAVVTIDISGKTADFTAAVVPVPVNRDGKMIEGLTVYPERVNVAFDLVQGAVKKQVDVKTVIVGDLPAGLAIKGITTRPAKVEVSGDAKVIEKLEFVYTEPFSVAGITKDTTKEAKLQLGDGLTATPSVVVVQISVGR
jgi:YbbR domain-containing protein